MSLGLNSGHQDSDATLITCSSTHSTQQDPILKRVLETMEFCLVYFGASYIALALNSRITAVRLA